MNLLEQLINEAHYTKVANLVRENTDITEGSVTVYKPVTSEGVIYNIPRYVYDSVISPKQYVNCDYAAIDIPKMFKLHTFTKHISNIKELALIASSILKNEEIYGVLCKVDNTLINLGHFMSPIFNYTDDFDKDVTFLIYSYKNKDNLDTSVIGKELSLISAIEVALSSSYHYKVTKSSAVEVYPFDTSWTISHVCHKSMLTTIHTTNRVILPASEKECHSLIPLFFVAKGTFAPYYGVAHIWTTSGGMQGKSVTIMETGNISKNGLVCVGDLSRTNYDSYRSLNYVNQNNAYYSGVLPKDWQSVAEAHKQYALIKLKGIIDDNTETVSPF